MILGVRFPELCRGMGVQKNVGFNCTQGGGAGSYIAQALPSLEDFFMKLHGQCSGQYTCENHRNKISCHTRSGLSRYSSILALILLSQNFIKTAKLSKYPFIGVRKSADFSLKMTSGYYFKNALLCQRGRDGGPGMTWPNKFPWI